MLAFSIPPPTPRIRIAKAAITAMNCHPLLPKEEAIPPNAAPNSSTEDGDRVAPVKAPKVYLKIHPITTV